MTVEGWPPPATVQLPLSPVARSNSVVVVKSILVRRRHPVSLGHHSICQSRARPCLHSPSASEGQTVQWSNGRHTMTCGQQRRTVVLSDERPGSPAGSMAKSEAPSAIADRATSASIPKVAIAPRSTHNRRFSPHDGREIIPPSSDPAAGKNPACSSDLRNACGINHLGKCFRLLVRRLLFKHASCSCNGFPYRRKNGVLKSPHSSSLPCYVPYLASDPLWTPRRL